jgi:hypothetical protein
MAHGLWVPPRVVMRADRLSPADAEVIRSSAALLGSRPEAVLREGATLEWVRRNAERFGSVSVSACGDWERVAGDAHRVHRAGLGLHLRTRLDAALAERDMQAQLLALGPDSWTVRCADDLTPGQLRDWLERHRRALSELPAATVHWGLQECNACET